jgi:hypothetical protein
MPADRLHCQPRNFIGLGCRAWPVVPAPLGAGALTVMHGEASVPIGLSPCLPVPSYRDIVGLGWRWWCNGYVRHMPLAETVVGGR